MIVAIFVLSTFFCSALLFVVEPMIAKMLLPLLGGTASVWNTCLVFFQALLLAGYLYADISSKWLGRRWQVATHLGLMASPLFLLGLLPLHLPAGWDPPAETSPIPWLLGVLFISVGLPFFVLSSTTPILQRWFAQSGHPDAGDPYFLYAASNAGSLAGLVAYPFILEPLLQLRVQSQLWSVGYETFFVAAGSCALLACRGRVRSILAENDDSAPLPRRQKLRWLLLAMVPSSLVLGVTTSLTTDLPAIPMLWIVTLSVYLLSFILVFARRPPIQHKWMVKREPFLILAATFPIISKTKFPFPVMLALGVLVLFGVAMVCHGEIARTRPQTQHLTEFYLWISFGGVLGGVFNALVAPVLFRSVLELPLALILAAILRPTDSTTLVKSYDVSGRRNDWLFPIALGLSMVMAITVLAHLGVRPGRSLNLLLFAVPLLWCLSFAERRWRFAGGLIALCVAGSFHTGPFGRVLHVERSFFGVSRVTTDTRERFHFLFNGGTAHGIESLDPARSREPLSYFTIDGPAGPIFRAAQTASPHGNWAIVGLGAGAMACYLQPGQTLTFYEIDPVVAGIARNRQYFRFLEQCAPNARVILGDARLKLSTAPDAHYGLIVLDAFSGDSIPIHLVTREALALYKRKLAPHGLIAFHISNLYVDLSRNLGMLAHDAHLICLIRSDTTISQTEVDAGKYPSIWVVMARSTNDLRVLESSNSAGRRWMPIDVRGRTKLWTDDYSNLLGSIRWNF